MSESKIYCPRCETEKNCRDEIRTQSYKVRCKEFTLDVPVWVCPCGETIVKEEFGDPTEKIIDR